MTGRRWTILVLTALVLGLVVWDVWLYLNPAPSDTISRVVFDLARKHPILPFALGVLAGHWFWGLRPKAPVQQ